MIKIKLTEFTHLVTPALFGSSDAVKNGYIFSRTLWQVKWSLKFVDGFTGSCAMAAFT